MDKLSQKDAVYEAIHYCRCPDGTYDKDAVILRLCDMHEMGKYDIKSDSRNLSDKSRKTYVKSMLANWLKKDDRLSSEAPSPHLEKKLTPTGNMQLQGGIFPTKVTVHNCTYSEQEWFRNIDLVMFRFPVRKKDGTFDVDLKTFSDKVFNSLNSGGWCVVFAYGPIENKLRPFEFAAALRDVGLTLVDIISINRPWWGGKRSDTHLALSYEHVFLFSKSDKWYLDRSPIYSLLSGDKYQGATCPGNSWDLNTYNPAENYSPDLASAIMKMVGLLPGSVVLDPFMGGKAGIEAASACGHSFIGYEVDKGKYDRYSKTLEKVKERIDNRDDDHSKGDITNGDREDR